MLLNSNFSPFLWLRNTGFCTVWQAEGRTQTLEAGCRGAVKLYADFFEADILVASPLALATLLLEQTGNPGAADFLSSVEICVVDHADVISMQNWTHLLTGQSLQGRFVNSAPELMLPCQ